MTIARKDPHLKEAEKGRVALELGLRDNHLKKIEYALKKFEAFFKHDTSNQRVYYLASMGNQRLSLSSKYKKIKKDSFSLKAVDYAAKSTLVSSLGEVILHTPLSIVETAMFSDGDKALNKISDRLDQALVGAPRSAAFFIKKPLCGFNSSLIQSALHQCKLEQSESYIRSAKSSFADEVNGLKAPDMYRDKIYLGHDKAHLGMFACPIQAYAEASLDQTKDYLRKPHITPFLLRDGCLRDNLLKYKRKTCELIINQYKATAGESLFIKPYFYNGYPCVMVHVKFDKLSLRIGGIKATSDAISAWVELVTSYFTALVNYRAQKNNVGIEIIRRSGFGYLTPTVAVCDDSMRINIGIVPRDYAQIIITSLKEMNDTFSYINSNFKSLDIEIPENIFYKDPAYREYAGRDISTPGDIFRLCFFKAETSKAGKMTIQNLMRTPFSRTEISACIYAGLHQLKEFNAKEYSQLFIDALRHSVSKIKLIGNSLSYEQIDKSEFKSYLDEEKSPVINDKYFWKTIEDIISSAKKQICHFLADEKEIVEEFPDNLLEEIEALVEHNKISGKIYLHEKLEVNEGVIEQVPDFRVCNLYYQLEVLNELLYISAILKSSQQYLEEDGYASDSDCESEEITDEPIYAKKIITQNGMRAIIASIEAASAVLLHHKIYLDKSMYYETPLALKALNVIQERTIKTADIIAFDANACVTDGMNHAIALNQYRAGNIKSILIDVTSATEAECHSYLEEFLGKGAPKDRVIFLVSSGLKNEQMGKDGNLYGTIRIFTKNKNSRNKLVDHLMENEKVLISIVAQNYRRLMKSMGNTPTNNGILNAKANPTRR